MDAVFIGDVGQVAAIRRDLEGVHVPRDLAQLHRRTLAGNMVAQGLELDYGAAHRFVGHVIDATPVRRIPEFAERGLAAIHREQREPAAGDVDLAGIGLVGRDVAAHQQAPAIGREVHRRPAATFLQKHAALAGAHVA